MKTHGILTQLSNAVSNPVNALQQNAQVCHNRWLFRVIQLVFAYNCHQYSSTLSAIELSLKTGIIYPILNFKIVHS